MKNLINVVYSFMFKPEKILNIIGSVLAVLSTIGIIVVFFKLIIFTEEVYSAYGNYRADANWTLFSAFFFAYLIVMGFAFTFKVLSKISEK